MKPPAKLLRFGRNELDVEGYELRRMGKRLRLARAPMELLLLLIEERGKLVTRQQITDRLWSEPEAVDAVQGINTAVNRLRAVLNDDPANPRYIETVIGKGYRFIAEVEDVQPVGPDMLVSLPDPPSAEAVPTPPVRRYTKRTWLIALFAGLALASAALLFIQIRNRNSAVAQKPVFSQLTANDGEDRITASAISPDGKLLAYADSSGVLLRVVRSGSEQVLDSPPAFQVDRISWFADDLRLAVSGYTATLRPQVWLVNVTGKPARLLHDEARNGTPSPDGDAFAYTSGRDAAIWVGGPIGEEPKKVVREANGESFPYVFWSLDSKRLLYERQRYRPSQSLVAAPKEDMETHYQWAYESIDPASGKVSASVRDLRFDSACLLPDNRMLYLRWDHAGRGQSYGLWEVRINPSNGSLMSSPHGLLTFESGTAAGISASSDGREIAAVLERDYAKVYVANMRQDPPALLDGSRLTHDLQSDFPHAWMPSSDSVIFESNRGGRFAIYQQRLSSRTPEMIASVSNGSFLPQVSPGGRWILFEADKSSSPQSSYSHSSFALYRVPIDGGNAEEVPIGGPLDEFRCPLAKTGGCILRETIGHQQLVYYALDPVKGKGRELGRTAWSPTLLGDWDVSSDGLEIALPIHDQANRTIRMVPLAGADPTRRERLIAVHTFGALGGVTFAADSKGFFASAVTNAGCDLLYVDLQGQATVLRKSANSTWGVPSPDGHKLAFVDYAMDSNVWMSVQKNRVF